MRSTFNIFAFVATLLVVETSGQTYRRLGGCPKLGCILPPDQAEFLAGQYFDLRVEVHSPLNGSEVRNVDVGQPDGNFVVTIRKLDGGNGDEVDFARFFQIDQEPELEEWSFGYYEDLFDEDDGKVTSVNVASKAYRRLALYEPGKYLVKLQYYGSEETTAEWTVRPLKEEKKARNIILFIGDGMTTNMITAARLIGHKSVNGKYKSRLALDEFPVLGHQMTHSLDSFITDSSNSASALYTGHKTSVSAAGVYADSSPCPFDDPKMETIVEMVVRNWNSTWGAVTTAQLADSTPTALTAHCRDRHYWPALLEQSLRGVLENYTWTDTRGPDVFFGGGAEFFHPHLQSFQAKDQFSATVGDNENFAVALNRSALAALPLHRRALGVFCTDHLPVWLDRNVFPESLLNRTNGPMGDDEAAPDLPGLKDMTLKAVDILHARAAQRAAEAAVEDEEGVNSQNDPWDDRGFFLMSEAASIDKQMHEMDYDRALGDLLELDDTVRATIKKLEELGILNETLLLVTADHGHGFDVFGSADTKYLQAQTTDRSKRRAIGVYAASGLSNYLEPDAEKSAPYENATLPVPGGVDGHFPTNWTPRFALAAGFVAGPDRRDDHTAQARPIQRAMMMGEEQEKEEGVAGFGGEESSTQADKVVGEYLVNPESAPEGIPLNGHLDPAIEATGVHSITDVPVFARGPCQDWFAGVYDNTEVFFRMAECFGLGRASDPSLLEGGEETTTGSTTAVAAASRGNRVRRNVAEKPEYYVRGGRPVCDGH